MPNELQSKPIRHLPNAEAYHTELMNHQGVFLVDVVTINMQNGLRHKRVVSKRPNPQTGWCSLSNQPYGASPKTQNPCHIHPSQFPFLASPSKTGFPHPENTTLTTPVGRPRRGSRGSPGALPRLERRAGAGQRLGQRQRPVRNEICSLTLQGRFMNQPLGLVIVEF